MEGDGVWPPWGASQGPAGIPLGSIRVSRWPLGWSLSTAYPEPSPAGSANSVKGQYVLGVPGPMFSYSCSALPFQEEQPEPTWQ